MLLLCDSGLVALEFIFAAEVIGGMTPAIRRLAGRLRDADTVTAELFSEVIRDACWRLPLVRHAKGFRLLERPIESGAWIDATLALLALEMPQWQVRHVTYDAGQWHCALSLQRDLPDWLDCSITTCHPDLCLAMLTALVDTKRDRLSVAEGSVVNSPRNSLDLSFCCDNFA